MVLLLWHIDLAGRSIVVYYKGKKVTIAPSLNHQYVFGFDFAGDRCW